MQIDRTLHGDVAVLAVDGRLDATTAPAFESALLAEWQAGVTRVVVDLARVQLISSAALRVLVSAAKQMKKQGSQILLCALTPEVAKVFGISGLAGLFDLQPTRDAALAALGVAAPVPTPTPTPTPTPVLPPDVFPADGQEGTSAATFAPDDGPAASLAPMEEVAPLPPVPADPPTLEDAPPAVLSSPASASAGVTPTVERIAPPPPVWLPPAATPISLSPPANPAADRRWMFVGSGVLAVFLLAAGTVLFSHRPKPRVTAPPAAQASPTVPPDAVARETPPAASTNPTMGNDQPSATPAPAPEATAPADAAAPVVTVPPNDPQRFDTHAAESDQTRQAVLRRIDAMPIQPAQRDRLYQAMDHARGMGKIITIKFGVGHTDLNPAAVADLKTALRRPDLAALLNDPSVVFVVLGYADSTGNPRTNKETSERRAERTLAALRDQCGMLNVMHAIGMGGSGLLDQEHLEKNRAVEVWAVVP